MKSVIKGRDYKTLLSDIKERIRSAQYQALRKVNKELITLYWDIGKMIDTRQKSHGWGKAIVENVSRDLQKEFAGVSGFSARNIWYMRNFYEVYAKNEKLQPMVAEIGWTHNVIILDKCKDDLEREFYICMTKKMGWTKNILIHQIENETYKKTIENQTNFSKALPSKIRSRAKLAVKDEYTFDFLELAEEHSESEFERGLMKKINQFLIEMGGVFTFMGNQFRLEISNKEYFIDLLLYHRRLKCLVAIELKIGEFKPEYAGKMQFYLSALDDLIKTKEENPSIGIILCRDKDRTIVEYALRESKRPIGVSTYRITTSLPKDLKRELPSAKQVLKLLDKRKS